MAKNPFLAHQDFETKPKRNAFDNSHRCYMTGKLGCLYPVMLIEVNSGDSIQIDSSFLFNFFPFVFPVQTPLKASIYFFYGRNRIFWDNWQDFAYNNKQPSHPFILQPGGDFWKTGELADFLGVPTTYSSLGVLQNYDLFKSTRTIDGRRIKNKFFLSLPFAPDISSAGILIQNSLFNFYDIQNQQPIPGDRNYWALSWDYFLTKDNYQDAVTFSNLPANYNDVLFDTVNGYYARFILFFDDGTLSMPIMCTVTGSSSPTLRFDKFDYLYLNNSAWAYRDGDQVSFGVGSSVLASFFESFPEARVRIVLCLYEEQVKALWPANWANPLVPLVASDVDYQLVAHSGISEVVDLSTLSANPFAGSIDNPPHVPINAIPFRFYEAVYNAYFRNERNDPFIVNGEIEYNKWNTTRSDGADSTPYKLYYRNWEADFLTTATQTPQQGLAPLVGINVRGDMEFLNEDGTIARIRPVIDADGHTITGISGIVENGSREAVRSAMELITSGISINDFRQVSSLQTWLENNLRRGLKYRDQVMANTGVKIKYDELDMPEFIGGFSRPVQVTAITQATPSTSSDNALGDRAGQASVLGGSKHKISHYCDEAGYIMAVMCVYPTPVYTQLLPKYFLKSDALSYYHPQFGSIGLQPISYREVCPIQVYQEGGQLEDTFGYQRPWYDLIANVDTAHGNMRTNMRDFLMHRTFAGIPRLGADFLHIDPEQLNDVFAITDGTQDVFQGQIYFNIFTKRAIPRFGIPRQI